MKFAFQIGFTLAIGLQIIGPVIIFPRTFLSWNIATSSDINVDNLCLFKILEPKLDMLIIGLDQNHPANSSFVKNLRACFKKWDINAEILPVRHAVPTYNFLAVEGRFVAAALVPPRSFVPNYISTLPMPKHERLPAW